jgi:hypothetical protein
MKERRDEFKRLGFIVPGDAVRLVLQCEAKVNNVKDVNIVPLNTTDGRPFHAAWITHDNQTMGLLVERENETMQKFTERAQDLKTRAVARYAGSQLRQSP